MNYIALKGRIEQAIQSWPLDIEAYNDLFDLCREYEKVDFTVAHEWNKAMRTQLGYGLRLAVEKPDFTLAERFNDLLFRSLLFGAPHFFDDYLQAVEYGKPLDKKFYQPRRHYLIVQSFINLGGMLTVTGERHIPLELVIQLAKGIVGNFPSGLCKAVTVICVFTLIQILDVTE